LFYWLRTDALTVMLVVTLMAYGCPVPAIVKAECLDERSRAGGNEPAFIARRFMSR